jgi:hypothetical protein
LDGKLDLVQNFLITAKSPASAAGFSDGAGGSDGTLLAIGGNASGSAFWRKVRDTGRAAPAASLARTWGGCQV